MSWSCYNHKIWFGAMGDLGWCLGIVWCHWSALCGGIVLSVVVLWCGMIPRVSLVCCYGLVCCCAIVWSGSYHMLVFSCVMVWSGVMIWSGSNLMVVWCSVMVWSGVMVLSGAMCGQSKTGATREKQ